jgi:hypothetical protein
MLLPLLFFLHGSQKWYIALRKKYKLRGLRESAEEMTMHNEEFHNMYPSLFGVSIRRGRAVQDMFQAYKRWEIHTKLRKCEG